VIHPATDAPGAPGTHGSHDEPPSSAFEVFRNRPFLLLWLSQAFTQVGGNMVIYGLTVIILEATRSKTAVGILILTFLVPAVLFSAVAGVYVDRFDRRSILVVTNLLRAGAFVLTFLAGGFLPAILILNVTVSTITVFFGPAEAAMIPHLVPRRQLLAANGVFTLTLNGAFALGFALLGPIVVTIAGAPALILIVAACYLVAAGFCWTLPSAPPLVEGPEAGRSMVGEAEQALGSMAADLREGLDFIQSNPRIGWSLVYLGIAASLVGVLGTLGPDFAIASLGLAPKDFVVVVLPLGFGVVTGILVLNSFGHLLPRRRIIEAGLVALGILLALLAAAGPIANLIRRAESATGLVSITDITSLLAVVVAIALLAGMSYAFVAIPSQTQLQEDIPEDVRGRVFGILNMLVSIASFLPIIIVAPIADLVGTTNVLIAVALGITVSGVASIMTRGPLKPVEARAMATGPTTAAALDPVAVAIASEVEAEERRAAHGHASASPGSPAPAGPDTLNGRLDGAGVPRDAVPDEAVPGEAGEPR
jgi:MFS family permease